MNMKKLVPLLLVLVVALLGITQTLFTVHQTQRALVLQLGKPTGEIRMPGLHFKLPFVQNVIYFDNRILVYDAQPAEILTSDKKTLVVDNYSKWRITDPLQFYRTVRTINGAQSRLDDVIYSQMRVALGRHTLTEIVSSKRAQIMALISKRSAELIKEYGIEVLDVRIKRTDLPPENARAIYGRMRAERERQAKQYRSEGQEESAKIKSQADREREVLLAEARRQAQSIRGEGDALATATYANALGQSPEFYSFQRSLEAYKTSFTGKTRVILTPDTPFLRYLR